MVGRVRLRARPQIRWRLLAALTALATCVALLLAARSEGVYWSQADVVFLPPARGRQEGNPLEGESESLLYFARFVERQVNGNRTAGSLTATGAPLYAQGVREGSEIVLPDTGGQWLSSFRSPTLRIEAVGPSPENVRRQVAQAVTRINAATGESQDLVQVAADRRITTTTVPLAPQVDYVGTNRRKGVLVIALLGGPVTLALLRRSRMRERERMR